MIPNGIQLISKVIVTNLQKWKTLQSFLTKVVPLPGQQEELQKQHFSILILALLQPSFSMLHLKLSKEHKSVHLMTPKDARCTVSALHRERFIVEMCVNDLCKSYHKFTMLLSNTCSAFGLAARHLTLKTTSANISRVETGEKFSLFSKFTIQIYSRQI